MYNKVLKPHNNSFTSVADVVSWNLYFDVATSVPAILYNHTYSENLTALPKRKWTFKIAGTYTQLSTDALKSTFISHETIFKNDCFI